MGVRLLISASAHDPPRFVDAVGDYRALGGTRLAGAFRDGHPGLARYGGCRCDTRSTCQLRLRSGHRSVGCEWPDAGSWSHRGHRQTVRPAESTSDRAGGCSSRTGHRGSHSRPNSGTPCGRRGLSGPPRCTSALFRLSRRDVYRIGEGSMLIKAASLVTVADAKRKRSTRARWCAT